MVFQSLPGDISEELKNERLNCIKLRFKKVKQVNLLLKSIYKIYNKYKLYRNYR